METQTSLSSKSDLHLLPIADALRTVRRPKFMGITFDDAMHYFFRGNATLSIVVLFLIVLFLFKEGGGFFGQNAQNLEVYRKAGLEFVDLVRVHVDDHRTLGRFLENLRTQQLNLLHGDATALASYDAAVERFSTTIDGYQTYLSDYTETATGIKEKYKVGLDMEVAKKNFEKEGKFEESSKIQIPKVDFESETRVFRDSIPQLVSLNETFQTDVTAALDSFPAMVSPELQPKLEKFKSLAKGH
ncbi:MAG: hypothetical protein V4507_17280, partial [Verrucomicrobiota bacterium]